MTEIEALRAIMSEVEALRQILKSEKPELANAVLNSTKRSQSLASLLKPPNA
jgi:hypothetical protein